MSSSTTTWFIRILLPLTPLQKRWLFEVGVSQIDHVYRFDQEPGLDVEGLRVQTLERMKRLFDLAFAASQLVFHSHAPLAAPGGALAARSEQ